MTKTELSQLYWLNKEIYKQKQQLEELTSSAESCVSVITDMPTGGRRIDKIERYAIELAELKSLIEINIQKCWYERNRLER